MSPFIIRNGFIAAGLANIGGVLLFSKGLTNSIIPATDPAVMSIFGLVMILVWGLAYISIANVYESNRWLVGVFCLEKLIYVVVWVRWLMNNDIYKVYEQDTFAGVFFSIYGINDLLFFLFFGWVFFKLSKK